MNPPFCPKCGAPAEQALVQLQTPQGPTPYGVCRGCFEIVKLARNEDGVAPFMEVVSALAAPTKIVQARGEIMARMGRFQPT